ncbi:MAG TPA: hybrid sensor histidine kinase/response regulator, partial [Burkholderiales bacterium]|nr:hybrid sensor histidine kinase/response regulator [Burkholderiales bacterium]
MRSRTVFIITPNETDASVALGVMGRAHLAARACLSLSDLCLIPLDQVGCIVLVEEALIHPDIDVFLGILAAQPRWSDLPLVLLASAGGGVGALVERLFPESGNVVVLERPMNPVSLIAAVEVGLRARHRQFEVRDLLQQRADAIRLRDEFLAMLAHELRNPLAPMRNAIYIMKQLAITDALFLKTRELMDRQVTHMARLVDDLLDVSRLESGKVQLQTQQLDLNAATRAATEACMVGMRARGHDIRLRLSEDPLMICADPVRLEQIVCNLVNNAGKFTPEGGVIRVSTAGDEDLAWVEVKDSGIGIRSDMLEAVFDLFTQDATTLDRAQGGLGIGLTIVKRLVELHGGSIRAQSEGVGLGSCFTVSFPRSVMALPDSDESRAAPTHPSAKRILVIEDNPDIRDSLGMMLNMWGHAVEYAETGTDGVLRANELQPDVALIDIGLPGLNGYEVARRIRSQSSSWASDVKLVALTGYGRDS